jgi:hypothetical protein
MANETINGKQMTICWHVDDLFMGHKDLTVLADLLRWLTNRYVTADKNLNITREHCHDYLGMTIDFFHQSSGHLQHDPIYQQNLYCLP